MQLHLVCQAITDLLEEKKIVPIEDLMDKHFVSLSEYKEFLTQDLSLPSEVFDLLLEESKTLIYSCCGNEYYFPRSFEDSDDSFRTCLECGGLIKNHYQWTETIPTLYVKGAGIKLIVKKDNFYIGRKQECDLCLDNIDLSRRHCCIRLVGEKYKVVDLGSRNGTFLNKKKVTEAFIKTGDVIGLGKNVRMIVGSSTKTSSIRKQLEEGQSTIGESSLTDLLIGVELGEYRIKENIGKGGMGVVYRAVNHKTGENVAIKMLRSSRADEPAVLDRFRKEKRILEQLSSPHIIKYYDAGMFNGMEYIILEYFGLCNLGEYLNENGPLPYQLAIEIILKVIDGLELAHAHGVIHRDIKPDNILIDEKFDVRITDFGLMKNLESSHTGLTTVTGVTLGTPSYMAPEQIKTAKAVTPQTDVYGVGATLYHMLTGRPPYEGVSSIEILMRVGDEPIEDIRELVPDLPINLGKTIMKCLEFDLNSRYPNGEALKEALLGELS